MSVFMSAAEWAAFESVTRPEARPERVLIFEGATS